MIFSGTGIPASLPISGDAMSISWTSIVPADTSPPAVYGTNVKPTVFAPVTSTQIRDGGTVWSSGQSSSIPEEIKKLRSSAGTFMLGV